MNLEDLSTFLCVAETGSFTEAAKKLHRPKSSVSRAVLRLEEEMHVRLIFRTTRQVALTSAGTSLFQRAAPSLAALRDSLRDVQREDEAPAGDLRLTAPNDLGVSFVAGCVARFTARYPAVRVEVSLTVRKVDLIKEGFDVALRFGRLADSSLIARKITPTEMHLYASPAYLVRHGTPRTCAELAGHDLAIFRPSSGPVAQRFEGPKNNFELASSGKIMSDDFSFLREVLRAGAGIGMLPFFLAEPDVAAGQLVRILPTYAAHAGALYIVYPPAKPLPARLVAFRDFVLESLAADALGKK